MYSEIHQLKSIGFKKSQAARQLDINIKIVTKYWEVDPDDFAGLVEQASIRVKKLESYHNVILGWLQQYPEISAAHVMDWLKEHYPDSLFCTVLKNICVVFAVGS